MNIKKCSKCNEEKELSEFYKDKYSKDLHRCKCKECSKKYREENKEYNSDYRKKNAENRKLYDKEYRIKNPEKLKERRKKYTQENSDKIKSKVSEYYINNREHLLNKQKEYGKNNKEKINNYSKNKRKKDTLYKLKGDIRNLIGGSIRNNGYSKKSKTCQILGCSFEEFKMCLESRFEPWMNWENRGLYNGELNYGWDIDHIIPISTATTEEKLLKLNHHTNLQPLCSKINRNIKTNKIEYGII